MLKQAMSRLLGGGMGTRQNILAWTVASLGAYILYVKPIHDEQKQKVVGPSSSGQQSVVISVDGK